MRYGIIGVGAVGGYYGARLAQHGLDVHFLLRGDYEHVLLNGLAVESYMGSFRLSNLNVYNDVRHMPKCDVVMVCLKTTSNSLLPQLLAPLLLPNSVVILVQNGIGVEASVQQMFPHAQLAAGVGFINCAKSGAGQIIHRGFGHISLCNYSCVDTAILHRVADDFNKSMVPAQVSDYSDTRWRKNILNMATNGLTVLLNARCDELISNPSSCKLVRDLMLEGVRAARACGVTNIHDDYVDQLIESTSRTVFATSMKYDFDHHLPLEIFFMYTQPITMAESHGCDLPRLRMLEQQLLYLEAHNEVTLQSPILGSM